MALLVILVKKVGADQITLALNRLGPIKFILLMIFPMSWYFLQSWAWYRILQDDGIPISLTHILLAKLTGEALNTITPAGFMGGDPYRVYLLQKKIPGTVSLSSVVIDRTMQTLAVAFLMVMTLVLALINLPLSPELKFILPLTVVILLLLTLLFIHYQKKGFFGFLGKILIALRIKSLKDTAFLKKLEDLDIQVNRFYKKHPIHFYEIFVLQLLGRFLGTIEIWLMAWLMGFKIGLLPSLYLSALTILINIVFVFIPGSIGVMEGGYGFLFHLLKMDLAQGVTLQLVRRIRSIFYVLIGLLIILIYQPSKNNPIKSAV